MTIMTKTEFSRYVGVDKSRVSQWLKAKQIGPRCLVGEGRNAKINVELAITDLRKKLDPDQRFGLNGLNTKLDNPKPATAKVSEKSSLTKATAPENWVAKDVHDFFIAAIPSLATGLAANSNCTEDDAYFFASEWFDAIEAVPFDL